MHWALMIALCCSVRWRGSFDSIWINRHTNKQRTVEQTSEQTKERTTKQASRQIILFIIMLVMDGDITPGFPLGKSAHSTRLIANACHKNCKIYGTHLSLVNHNICTGGLHKAGRERKVMFPPLSE